MYKKCKISLDKYRRCNRWRNSQMELIPSD
jgi:hypothetical protein